MKPIKPIGQKWLKCFHVFFSTLWVVGVVTLTLMNFLLNPKDAMSLHGANLAKKFVDDFIIIPGAVGCCSTALLYSFRTRWGWIRHRWLAAKWAIHLVGVISGVIWLRPWISQLPEISQTLGIAALSDPLYQHTQAMLAFWGTAQALTLVLAAGIAVWKPWRTHHHSDGHGHQEQQPNFPAGTSTPLWHSKH